METVFSSYLREEYGFDSVGEAAGQQPFQCASESVPSSSHYNSTPSKLQQQTPVTRASVAGTIESHFQCIFPFSNFNAMQSECMDAVYRSDLNVVVSAPTGAGKTVLFELAMARLFAKAPQSRASSKAIYLAPLKSLVHEKFVEWKKRFGKVGRRVVELTSDTHISFTSLNAVDAIVTTPEKWDSMTRRWKSNSSLMDSIGLLMIDEVHLLGEPRGACLEGLVSRCKLMKSKCEADAKRCAARNMRFIALSATIPNLADVAEWLSAKMFLFDDRYRPVPLEHHVIGRPMSQRINQFVFDKSLNFQLFDIIKEYSDGKPVLVFCATRRGCDDAARAILSSMKAQGYAAGFVDCNEQKRVLAAAQGRAHHKTLQEVVARGVGVHTAGMEFSDRQLVERMFLAGDIQVICATTTLAQGINLPAHLVIVKSTKRYVAQVGWTDYNKQEILQMIGRAGRPQFDKRGVAVILTDDASVQKYEDLLSGQTLIESHLSGRVIDHLNAEVVMGTVQSPREAVEWIESTFLAVRMTQNPKHYGVKAKDVPNELASIVKKDLSRLCDAGLTVSTTADLFRASLLGELMAKYYLHFETMAILTRLRRRSMELREVLRAFVEADEFTRHFRIRMGEKTVLNGYNKGSKMRRSSARYTRIRYPIKGKVSTVAEKIYILIQVALAHQKLELWDLKMDVEAVVKISSRVLGCFCEYLVQQDICTTARSALVLKKCISRRMWHDDEAAQIQQLNQIGPKLGSAFVASGVKSLHQLEGVNPLRIESITGRRYPFGVQLRSKLHDIPLLQVALASTSQRVTELTTGKNENGSSQIYIAVRQLRPEFKPSSTKARAHLLVADPSGRLILHRNLTKLPAEQLFVLRTKAKPPTTICCFIVHDNLFGYDSKQVLRPYGPGNDKDPAHVHANKEEEAHALVSDACSEAASTPLKRSQPDSVVSHMAEAIPTKKRQKTPSRGSGCRHSYPKCLSGACSHACCKRRFQARESGPQRVGEELDSYRYKTQQNATHGLKQQTIPSSLGVKQPKFKATKPRSAMAKRKSFGLECVENIRLPTKPKLTHLSLSRRIPGHHGQVLMDHKRVSMISASSHRKVIGPSHSSSEDAAKVTQNASKWQNSEILVSVEPTERCGKQYAALFSDLF